MVMSVKDVTANRLIDFHLKFVTVAAREDPSSNKSKGEKNRCFDDVQHGCLDTVCKTKRIKQAGKKEEGRDSEATENSDT